MSMGGGSSLSSLLIIGILSVFFPPGGSQTTTPPSSPITNATEAVAVEAIFRKLKMPMNWNTTTDPCTGAAVDSSVSLSDVRYNPLIKCDCSSGSCRITQLKIYAQSASGEIPEELQHLTSLTNLNMDQNMLTGPIPSFIGKLINMQEMSFGINALSGSIPKEIGNLAKLRLLGMGTNNFNGTFPTEFGKLTNLEELYMDSSGVGGEIPSWFSGLSKLRILWASDNNFRGRIPDFFGQLGLLTVLRLQGNSLAGPIPSSFGNLTKLSDLRIGDIINGSSSMSFITNMTSLEKLVLRNAKISGAIISNIANFTNLQILDLSFNNLSGAVPPALFNLNKLQILLLGNNTFSGSLPSQKIATLTTIDFSYNNFSGAFPTWASENNLNMNLVGNSFALSSSIESITQELECLQKGIPCFRGSPIWSNFSINCGGTRSIISSDGLLYEKDDGNINAASYHVSPDKRWAISNVGTFIDAPNSSYTAHSSSQFSGTMDTELFQSARLSPSSLRYYGLGLENGSYTVRLQFAEIEILDSVDWKSLGRRVFDIYIQGRLEEKDFDIKREAGGKSKAAVVREFLVNVTENFLEIHLFWAGKGTCCVPQQGKYGPSVSAISVKPNFVPTVSNQLPGSSKKDHTALIVGLTVSLTAFLFFVVCLFFIWRKRKNTAGDDPEFLGLDIKSEIFSYAELKTATGNFNSQNKLGEGGFGAVFKGTLSDGRDVAVKQLSVTSHQGKEQFVTEIGIITAVQHKNLVKLYGCCYEGTSRLLVYEHLENRSLDQALFGSRKLNLDWPSRVNICLGTARGLAYLHEESSVRIVHRDMKASNILLDSDLNPKISDFGLAKLYDDKKTHISTRIAGTIGYLAPEYALRGHLTEKADVFGFGVVSLEIVSGRPNTDSSLDNEKIYLLEWAWQLQENGCELDLMDPKLDFFKNEEAIRITRVALLCTQTSPLFRPSMSKVVSMLTGDAPLGEIKSRPAYLTALHPGDLESSMFTVPSVSASTAGPVDVQIGGTSSSTDETQSMLRHAVSKGR